jgi:hypothetical protein
LAIRNKLHEDAILIENGIDIDKIIDINRNQKRLRVILPYSMLVA